MNDIYYWWYFVNRVLLLHLLTSVDMSIGERARHDRLYSIENGECERTICPIRLSSKSGPRIIYGSNIVEILFSIHFSVCSLTDCSQMIWWSSSSTRSCTLSSQSQFIHSTFNGNQWTNIDCIKCIKTMLKLNYTPLYTHTHNTPKSFPMDTIINNAVIGTIY